MKHIYLFILIVFLSTTTAQSSYWQKITNLPLPYNNNYWLDIYFHPSNTNYGWVCGFNGQVLRTTNGGTTWIGSTIAGADHMESIHFPTLSIGYTSGVEGIFKSTDGGANWIDITPDYFSDYWGCFFLDANNGMVVGDGCGTRPQHFYRTSNGGTTWTLFSGSEPNSGLTDVMLMPSGIGYASSSGKIWVTTDAGYSWAVLATTGSNIWQEEITNVGNSFLVPTAGSACSGGGSIIGGMRFSTNYGATWKETLTPESLFGTFLINATTGWACGYNRQVYYTSDAGANWKQANCGIIGGSLDDIWFNSPTDGWVVGQGIYKLMPSDAKVEPEVLNFHDKCMPVMARDTILLQNLSFDQALAQFSITGADAADFSIVYPNSLEEYLSPCEKFPIIIQFNPQSIGNKTAQFNISINSKNIIVPLLGNAKLSTIRAANTVQTMNPAILGSRNGIDFTFTSTFVDTIKYVLFKNGNSAIQLSGNFPIVVGTVNTLLPFTVSPLDTGWIEADFEVFSQPCDNIIQLKIKAYGVSPIIESPSLSVIDFSCFQDTIFYIPIRNTGNAPLELNSIDVAGDRANFTIEGFTSGKTMPLSIAIGSADTLRVRFQTQVAGSFRLDLNINNNDATTIRGIKSPYTVSLLAVTHFPKLDTNFHFIDFGSVCFGDTLIKTITLRNTGNLKALLTSSFKNTRGFFLVASSVDIMPNDSISFKIGFSPITADFSLDSIYVNVAPCNDFLIIKTTGSGLDNTTIIAPNKITAIAQTNTTLKKMVRLISKANIDQTVKALSLLPQTPFVSYSLKPSLPQVLKAGDTLDFEVSFTILDNNKYAFDLCFELDNQCPQKLCIPAVIEVKNRLLAIDFDSLDFGLMTCSPIEIVRKVNVNNLAFELDTIVSINLTQNADAFRIVLMPALPVVLAAGEELQLDIAFLPQTEGYYFGNIEIRTKEPDGQTINLPIKGEYKTVRTALNRNTIDFGAVEYCLDARQDTVYFANSGELRDSLQIEILSNDNFEILPKNIIVIDPKGKAALVVSALVPQMLALGLHELNLRLTSIVCGEIYLINAKIETIRPQIIFTPNPVDFGNVWAGETQTKYITATNSNILPRQFEILGVEPSDAGFSVEKNTWNLARNATQDFIVTFSSQVAGDYEAELIIRQWGNCEDTVRLPLRATVPKEQYFPKFILGDYSSPPGDTISMFVSLDTAVKNVNLTRAEFAINFSANLFYPYEMRHVGQSNLSIPFNFSKNALRFSLDEPQAKNLLHEAGDKFEIKGVVLLSLPDFTPVIFSNIYLETDKPITVLEQNGSLQLYDYCLPRAGLNFQFMPTIEIKNAAFSNNEINVELENTSPQNVKIEVYGILGELALEQNEAIAKGKVNLKMDATRLGNGLYFMIISTNFNQSYRYKLLLAK